MWVNRHQTSSELYAKLATKYAELEAIDRKDTINNVQKMDHFDVSNTQNLDENDYQRVLQKFKSRDSEVKSHEQAHAASGITKGAIQYNYQMGPDGKMYAVGGSVRLDTSIPDDPKAAQVKLDKIKDAASASSDMSGADSQITISANLMKMKLAMQGEENANI